MQKVRSGPSPSGQCVRTAVLASVACGVVADNTPAGEARACIKTEGGVLKVGAVGENTPSKH